MFFPHLAPNAPKALPEVAPKAGAAAGAPNAEEAPAHTTRTHALKHKKPTA